MVILPRPGKPSGVLTKKKLGLRELYMGMDGTPARINEQNSLHPRGVRLHYLLSTR